MIAVIKREVATRQFLHITNKKILYNRSHGFMIRGFCMNKVFLFLQKYLKFETIEQNFILPEKRFSIYKN